MSRMSAGRLTGRADIRSMATGWPKDDAGTIRAARTIPGATTMEFLIRAIVIGAGATVLLDIWAQLLQRVAGWPAPNWAMPGRWFAHLLRGQVAHEDIGRAQPVANELAIGWAFHYAVGILFAAVLLALWGLGWSRSPTFGPALIVGLVTVGCGWFILQPGMGAGIAASKKPNAWTIRALNIVGHIVFAIGLYGTALLTR
jgi:hypothetical protein